MKWPKVSPSTATNSSWPVLSRAMKKSAKKRHSLHELSNRAYCSLLNIISSKYYIFDIIKFYEKNNELILVEPFDLTFEMHEE